MKKTILGLSLLTLTFQTSAQTQIGNSGFESWDNLGQNSVEPTNFNSFMTAEVANFFGSGLVPGKQVDRSTLKRPGSTGTYSAVIWARSIFGVAANGNTTCGRINVGSASASDASNHNKTVLADPLFSESFNDTPDSLVVWVKYKPVNTGAGHQARVSCAIHSNAAFRDPNDLSNTSLTRATAQLNISYNGNNWQRISIPFDTVNASVTPAYIITTFTTNKTPGVGSVGDSIYVDDMELIYVPKASFTASTTSICPNTSVNFSSTSTNYPATFSWNFGDGSPVSTAQNPSHTFTTAGTYNVTLTATNQWGATTSVPVTITVNAPDDATFNYSSSTYCADAGNQTPTVVDAGTFTSTAGLSINATTGVINPAASTAGTYTVTNTTSGTCPDTKTTSITINALSDASFNYPSNTICLSDGNQTPTVAMAGTFSSTTGLVFANTTTGEINVSGSTAGTYVITYNVGGTCPNSSQVSVTLTSTPDASFSYANPAYCINGTDPAPVFGAGANGGVFSSTAGLIINSNSGVIDLSASTAGTYTVTNTIAAVGTCPSDVETSSVIVHALPAVALGNFTDVCVYNPAFALTGGTPAGGTYSGTGVTGGNFNPATAGVGAETITYSYTDAATSCSNTAVNTINVEECLGLNENQIHPVSVYPNPTDGKLTLSTITASTTFQVVSISGQTVLSGIVSSTADTIDFSSFENGVYVLQLTQEQGVQTIRIVKK